MKTAQHHLLTRYNQAFHTPPQTPHKQAEEGRQTQLRTIPRSQPIQLLVHSLIDILHICLYPLLCAPVSLLVTRVNHGPLVSLF
jgi:hypothetical protein